MSLLCCIIFTHNVVKIGGRIFQPLDSDQNDDDDEKDDDESDLEDEGYTTYKGHQEDPYYTSNDSGKIPSSNDSGNLFMSSPSCMHS